MYMDRRKNFFLKNSSWSFREKLLTGVFQEYISGVKYFNLISLSQTRIREKLPYKLLTVTGNSINKLTVTGNSINIHVAWNFLVPSVCQLSTSKFTKKSLNGLPYKHYQQYKFSFFIKTLWKVDIACYTYTTYGLVKYHDAELCFRFENV